MLAGYIAGCAAFYLLQDRLLYRPAQLSKSELNRRAKQIGYKAWPSAGDCRAYLVPNDRVMRPGTVLLVHGKGGSATSQTLIADGLNTLGMQVIVNEYPGYGARPGRPSARTLTSDLVDTIRLLQAERAGPLILVGVSVGTGIVAQAVAGNELPVDAVLLFTPFDSRRESWQERFFFIPITWLMTEDLDTVRDLKNQEFPVGVVVAELDRVTHPKQGVHLYESLTGPKRLWRLRGTAHTDWMTKVDDTFWQDLADWTLAAIVRPRPDPK
ncbi:MAG: alpha/beta fold hydrolase [Planctomycetes bacterium]|nr:alpha/beta fold hydrolase [Planctomycetota bacterium]